jgi:hypothetical protein
MQEPSNKQSTSSGQQWEYPTATTRAAKHSPSIEQVKEAAIPQLSGVSAAPTLSNATNRSPTARPLVPEISPHPSHFQCWDSSMMAWAFCISFAAASKMAACPSTQTLPFFSVRGCAWQLPPLTDDGLWDSSFRSSQGGLC